MKQKINLILDAVIIAGIIILFIGLYYSVIKAGIPYQDPPLELQIQYEIHAKIGDILTGSGFKIALWGSIVRLGLHLQYKIKKRSS